MSVGLSEPENLLPIAGVRLATVASGIRYQNRDDLLLIELSSGANTAAVFTTNAFCAAPVIVAKEHLAAARPKYLLINAGNANAGTGQAGIHAARSSCDLSEATAGIPSAVLPFSTGVIGEQLAVSAIAGNIPRLLSGLDENNWHSAASAIMTTDTVAKGCSREITIDGNKIIITGISKGSGMICPNMATMLAFIATDAAIQNDNLQPCLESAVAVSFNRITVDGDTSTNDACVLMATGASGIKIQSHDDLEIFTQTLSEVCIWLAQASIRDAEGATKFVSIEVEKALDADEASQIAYTIAHSPLVKTALYASDPNWGRILAAVGRAPVNRLDMQKIDIFLGDVCVIHHGEPAEDYTEAQGKAVLEQDEIRLGIVLGRGEHSTTIWTSDLSHDYVSINADYRS